MALDHFLVQTVINQSVHDLILKLRWCPLLSEERMLVEAVYSELAAGREYSVQLSEVIAFMLVCNKYLGKVG